MKNYVIFDIETTGFAVEVAEITQLAAIKMNENFEVVGEFQSYIKVEKGVPQSITELTGITEEMLQNAPELKAVLTVFNEFVNDATIVAHNSSFDVEFINYNNKILGLRNEFKTSVCTMKSFQMYDNTLAFNLKDATSHFGIELNNAHTAIGDCQATAQLFTELLKRGFVFTNRHNYVVLDKSESFVEESTRLSKEIGKLYSLRKKTVAEDPAADISGILESIQKLEDEKFDYIENYYLNN